MLKRKLIPLTVLLLLFIGCDSYYLICSLNPFYLEKNIVLETRIEGSWLVKPILSGNESSSSTWGLADTTSTWNIKQFFSKWVVKSKKGVDSTTFKPENYLMSHFILLTPKPACG